MRNKKMSTEDAMNAVKAFTEQSEKNVAFGVLADTEHGNISTFIKGEESDILALLTIQMARESDFKQLLLKAVAIYKNNTTEIIQKAIKEDENKHSRNN